MCGPYLHGYDTYFTKNSEQGKIDPFKEIFKLPVRGSTALGVDSQQTDNKRGHKNTTEN